MSDSHLLGGVMVEQQSMTIAELAAALDDLRRKGALDLAATLRERGHADEDIKKAQKVIRQAAPAQRAMRLLVVDDEPVITSLLGSLLEDAGYQVETAESIEEARRLWADAPFDIALLDKNLPDGSGVELASELTASGHPVEIAIVTGYANTDSAIEALSMRVADYVTKPFDNAQILARVQRMAAVSLLRNQNRRLHERLKQQKDAAIKAISEALKQLGREDSAGCHKTLSSALVELVTPGQ